ncbi:Hydroquinone glucosyltransferase [Bienertia sinuspersici]
MATTNTQKQRIVIIPSPGMGHLIPLVEFAKLLHSHHFLISILLPSSSPPTTAQTTFLATLPPAISHTFLPPVDPTLLPPTAFHSVIIYHIHLNSISSVRSALVSLSNVVAVVTDLFGTDYFDVARETGIAPYMYFTSNAFCLSFVSRLPKLDETVPFPFPYQCLEHPLVLPGCVPLNGKDFDQPTLDRQSEEYKLELYHSRRYNLAEGIFINTFFDLEPGALHGLKSDDVIRTSIYPIGPIIQSGSDDGDNVTLSWLDRKPPGSVLFVSFGSGGTLSFQQIKELAIGLEKSGLTFLWVVKAPDDESACGSFFGSQNQQHDYNCFDFLPKGYVERIKDRGLLVPFWAPQVNILAHESTGGFLTHCGWNSILESIVYGVPLIAWPLYAEQRMNAVMLNKGLKVALRTNDNERGFVGADEIARVVNVLMNGEEGEKARDRMKELSEAAKKATSEGGDSTKVISQVALKW